MTIRSKIATNLNIDELKEFFSEVKSYPIAIHVEADEEYFDSAQGKYFRAMAIWNDCDEFKIGNVIVGTLPNFSEIIEDHFGSDNMMDIVHEYYKFLDNNTLLYILLIETYDE